MSVLISLWTFFSLGNFHSDIFPHAYQYMAIVLAMLGIIYKSNCHKNYHSSISFWALSGWLVVFTCVGIILGCELVTSLGKIFIYLFMTVGYFKIACSHKNKYFIKSVLLGCMGIMLISFLFVLFMPYLGVEQDKFSGSWRGIFDQKNALGRVCTIATFCSSYLLFNKPSRNIYKLFYLIVIAASLMMCIKTGSRTSLIICVLNVFIVAIIYLIIHSGKLKTIALKKTLCFSFMFICIAITSIIYFSSPYGLHTGLDGISILGKNISLTGRLTIWNYAVSNSIEWRPWFGYGMDNFWTDANFKQLGRMVGMGTFYPHDSHNGLVDLFVQTGIVGTCIYLFGLLSPLFFWKNKNIGMETTAMFFCMLVFFIFSNMTESYVTKSTNMINALMIIFWMKMFIINKSNKDEGSNKND